MRWGSTDTEFVRPVHWAILLHGDRVIDCEILGVRAGRATRGHRFHCPAPFDISSPAGYADELLQSGKVIARFDDRAAAIRRLATEAAAVVNGAPHLDPELIDEVAALVEWPVPVTGRFDARFLSLPAEVLVTTLQGHQKYFPVKDPTGKILPYFVTFSNLESRNPETVRAGNERVVTPRLSDAEFFWKQDRRQTLDQRVASLGAVTFQAKLGSLLDKVERVRVLSRWIADELMEEQALVERAAWLSKADLLTEMVGEFPNLQGIMGRYYALAEGEPASVASAIEEHYQPRMSGGELPESLTGQILAIADKVDSLAGIFSAGLLPSGDRDPYGLRRAALGVVRIVLEKRLDLDLYRLVDKALSLFHHAFDASGTLSAVVDFMTERLRGHFLEQRMRPDEIESVLSLGLTRPLDCERRLQAVADFRGLPAAESLAAANKRIRNLLRKSETAIVGNVDDQLLSAGAETELFSCARAAQEDLLPMLGAADYSSALARLAELKEPVDRFFDEVRVMAEDSAIRDNRLGLLALVERLFLQIADIGKLQP
jgi:glycyl-tRNA synthetase beta chain